MKTGLVLEGGGLRGIFSAGVLDVLMEEGIKFDGGVGVSAGAAFGSNYKSGQNRRAIRYNLRFAKDPRYSSLRSLIATGNLFNAQFCYHDIPEKLDPFDWEAFRENPMEFYLVCTDMESGEPVYHKCEKDESEWELLEWFRASGSMPIVSRVVEIGDQKLLDGGISDSIPLRFMEEQGYERNLVILTRPLNYVKTGNPLMPVIRRGLSQYPKGVLAIENRHLKYNEELAYVRQRENGGFAFVIRPKQDLDIGRVEHDRTKIRAAYKEGRKMARRNLPAILRFLANAELGVDGVNGSKFGKDEEVSGVVKPSLVDDPTMLPETEEPVEADTNAADYAPDAVDYAAVDEEPVKEAVEDTSVDQEHFVESRVVIFPEAEGERQAFLQPFPAGREPDRPIAEEAAEEETAEAEAEKPAEVIELVVAETPAEEPATEETVERTLSAEEEAETPEPVEAAEAEAETPEAGTEEAAAEEPAVEPVAKETEAADPVAEAVPEKTALEEAFEKPASKAENVDAAEAPVEFAGKENVSGVAALRRRNSNWKQKGTWKPGHMSFLKEKAKNQGE